MSKFALVYQAGIANIFEVGEFARDVMGRKTTKRVMQHAFRPCEDFCRGMQHVGAEIAIYSCNRAGDITEELWTRGLQDCPFAEAARPSRLWQYT